MPEITIGQRVIAYSIRRSKRAKYVNFRIHPLEGLEVVLPQDLPQPNIESLLQERRAWILKHIDLIGSADPPDKPRNLQTGDEVLFLGEAHTLEISQLRVGKRASVGRQAGYLRVRLPADVGEIQQPVVVRVTLENWYRLQAKHHISGRVADFAAQYGFDYNGVTIKGQKTRWGSCSSKGNLNFNWRLMMAPSAAIDYVVIHELCHLRELNHSKRFWGLVGQYCPNYVYWERWLKEHGAELQL